ncbi:MAG: TolC family protein [Chitinophagaceae bacterium]|nr:MAG: TolC family protein [Chitinophagaceae bacterium]
MNLTCISTFVLGLGLLVSCRAPAGVTKAEVASQLQSITGASPNPVGAPGAWSLPTTVQAGDGISADEAVSIALWNNAQFQVDLAAIPLAQADLTEAAMVPNPLLRYLAPTGAVAASGYINFAFDFLFQRQRRIAAARVEGVRSRELAVQRGYGLIRDVQVAYTEALFARERFAIMDELHQLRAQMAQLAASRLRNGDISELEVSTVRADSAIAADDRLRAALDTMLRRNSLNILLGLRPDTVLVLQPAAFPDSAATVPTAYLDLAFSYQPELRAAQLAIESAGKRLGWERSRILAFTATLNFQHLPDKGGSAWTPNTFNPGVQLELPLFSRNQGRIARARAELEAASYQYIALRQRVALEAANTFDRYRQAWSSYRIWSQETLPRLEEAVRLSQSAYRNGDISYLPVLEAQRQLQQARLRRAELQAEIGRSLGNINYAIGNQWTK